MKVCLIHPPHINSTDDRLDPPMGLMMIATHLELNGFKVGITDLSGTVHDFTSWDLDTINLQSIWNIPYADIYGITVYITSISITQRIIKICKQINPNCKIIVGGAHPTARPNDFPFSDHVVVGNGEVAMVNIAKGKEKNRIVYGTIPEDYFMFPAYHLVDINSYHRKIDGKVSLPYLTSRGCPYSCNFCGLSGIHKSIGRKVYFADSAIVVAHLKRIKEEFGVERIAFQDDIFTMKLDRLKEIMRITEKYNIRFRCMGRASYDTEETYKILADGGCEQVSFGVESGSQYILDRMNKKSKVSDNYDVIKWAKKYGITSRAFFVILFPGETKETLEETKRFIVDSDVDQYFISTFVPYPGTSVGDNPNEFGIINMSNDFSQFYQVSKDGTGGSTIDTKWLSMNEARELELEFREWLKINKPFKGTKQEYEKVLYEKIENGI